MLFQRVHAPFNRFQLKIVAFTDELVEEYTEKIGEIDKCDIKEQIVKENFHNCDNLRRIKRKVMNCFVPLVGENSVWKVWKTDDLNK